MKCLKCNSILPDDSEFCQFCGTKIEGEPSIDVPTKRTANQEEKETQKQESISTPAYIVSSNNNHTTHKSEQESVTEQHCKKCGGYIDSSTKRCTSCGKQYFKFRPLVLAVILLAVFLATSVGFNAYQYYVGQEDRVKINEMNSEIFSLEGAISSQKSTIFSLKDTVASQKTKISSLNTQVEKNKDKADSYDDLISALSSGNLGYAANNFQSSESVIVVSKAQSNRKFTLTANWSNGGAVSTSYSPSFLPSAYVSFDNDEWNISTTMTIEPIRAGITAVTFSNNVDSKTFKVIIIVTE